MKNSLLLLLIFFIMVCNSIGYSQSLKHQFEINQFEIKSKSVKEEIYPIEVFLPEDYDSTKRYPIVYFTDWWLYNQYHPQTYHYLIEPIIIVGIGTIGDENDWRMERVRDLTPTHLSIHDTHDSLKLGSRGISGGAKSFLSFIKNELIPVIESEYPSDTLNRGFVGYSYGGLFGAYILSSEPKLFQKYLLGRPNLNYDDFVIIDRLKGTNPNKFTSVKSIFISVGEEETGDYLKGFADFRDLILTMDLPNLVLKSIIIEEEGHGSAFTPTFIKGLKFLYGK